GGALGLDRSAATGPILAPGLGAQGGPPADLGRLFGPAAVSSHAVSSHAVSSHGVSSHGVSPDGISPNGGPVVLPATSRDVLRHGPTVTGLRDAAERVLADLRATLTGPPGGAAQTGHLAR